MKTESLKVVLLNKKQLDRLSKNFNLTKVIIAVIASAAILNIPTTSQSVSQTLTQFITTLALIIAMILLSAGAAKILGGENKAENIVNASSISMALSLALVSIPAGLITLWLIPLILHTYLFSSLLFSIIPFYNFLIFGWAVEESSRNKNQARKTITAIVSLTLVMLLYIAISVL